MTRGIHRYIFPDRVPTSGRTDRILSIKGGVMGEIRGSPAARLRHESRLESRTHGARALRASPSVLFALTSPQASPRALGQGLMCLMEAPECRYQFCRDSHDLAATRPIGTLSKFIDQSAVRKQSLSPPLSPVCDLPLCSRILIPLPNLEQSFRARPRKHNPVRRKNTESHPHLT